MKSICFFALLILSITFSREGKAAITRDEFESVIQTLTKIYKPIVKELGGELHIYSGWESTIQNAVALRERYSKNWEIYTFGGLARIKQINKDGFALVICHELGHHIAGYPKFIEDDASWSSAEGQADYFATLKCARKLFEKDDNEEIVKNLKVPSIVLSKCKKSFTNQNEINICIRSNMAAKNMTVALESVRGNAVVDDTINSFETPAPPLNRVYISTKHPGIQCRLDTLFAGALCDKNVNEKLSNKEETNGNCAKANGDTVGIRPPCWYRID